MRKATRHKCTSLFCLGVVVVPLIVFVLSAFLAIWLWLLEADLAGCFKPGGEDTLPPSPPPPGPLDEEELGSGSRQLAIGAGASASHTNATSGAASERPICSYYEWCALAAKARQQHNPHLLLTSPRSVRRVLYVLGNLVGVGLTSIQPVSGSPPAELFDLLIATWSLTLTGATRRRATRPPRASFYL